MKPKLSDECVARRNIKPGTAALYEDEKKERLQGQSGWTELVLGASAVPQGSTGGGHVVPEASCQQIMDGLKWEYENNGRFSPDEAQNSRKRLHEAGTGNPEFESGRHDLFTSPSLLSSFPIPFPLPYLSSTRLLSSSFTRRSFQITTSSLGFSFSASPTERIMGGSGRANASIQAYLTPITSPVKSDSTPASTVSIGDGFTTEEVQEALRLKAPESWHPAEDYADVEISDLYAGPRAVTFMGRVCNIFDSANTPKTPRSAKGCIKLCVKDGGSAITVCSPDQFSFCVANN